jgi:hypothetical protein
MKTNACCPTCGFPFSFWKVAFALSPFSLYCDNCEWRIVIRGDKTIMWATIAVLALISVVIFSFMLPRNLPRLVLLSVLWLVCFEILEIIVGLMIINWGQFSQPEQADSGDQS